MHGRPVRRTARNWARQVAWPGWGAPQALRATSDEASDMPVVALVMLALRLRSGGWQQRIVGMTCGDQATTTAAMNARA